MGYIEGDFDGESSRFDGEKCAAADARTAAEIQLRITSRVDFWRRQRTR